MPCSLVTRISSAHKHASPHGVPGSCCRASAISAIAFKRGNHCQRNAGVTTGASINTSPGLISPRFSASTIIKAPHDLLPNLPGYCLPVLTTFTAVIRPHSLQLHQRRIAYFCSNVLTISIHTWCCLMRRLASYQAYRLQTLPLKSPDRGNASGRLTFTQPIRRFVREQVLIAGFDTLVAVIQPRMLQTNNKRSPRCGASSPCITTVSGSCTTPAAAPLIGCSDLSGWLQYLYRQRRIEAGTAADIHFPGRRKRSTGP